MTFRRNIICKHGRVINWMHASTVSEGENGWKNAAPYLKLSGQAFISETYSSNRRFGCATSHLFQKKIKEISVEWKGKKTDHTRNGESVTDSKLSFRGGIVRGEEVS
ncbi:MAG: hypothetical protein K0Q56_2612, partial [Sporolactobacillus laevolacticus]|nr:hypothetical protein [Sporolactobacillus laevolacticus]